MEKTIDAFKTQQGRALEILKKLQAFLDHGERVGVDIPVNLKTKLATAIHGLAGEKLKVALIGGFSEGKTSIAAAWMEKLDRSTMNISHQESSNEVRIYDVGPDLVLIDTPGLFGFKEQLNAETHEIEKYKDITKKYVSEAHLVLYVMNSTNPIKESHKEDLTWLFRTLNLLPRTVFVLSRFDEVADVEDESEYQRSLSVKRSNVTGRLEDLIGLTRAEASDLAIVAVAANPFEMGMEHWLANLDTFKALSHIASLQEVTSGKIQANGGAAAIADEAKKSVIRDVLTRQMPIAIDNHRRISEEVDRLDAIGGRLQRQLASTGGQIANVRISLRDFVANYFSDLILQVQGQTLESFRTFFEREIGAEGIVLMTRLQNEFERQTQSVNLEISKLKVGLQTDVNHFNTAVKVLGKQGLDYVVKSKLINNTTVLATRDGVVAVAKTVGMDLGGLLKFKPWGAVNLAKGLNGLLSVFGLAMEAWDSWDQWKREEAFAKSIGTMVHNFEEQRVELIALINAPQFEEQFFPDYIDLKQDVSEVEQSVQQKRRQSEDFSAWREMGEAIDTEFSVLAG